MLNQRALNHIDCKVDFESIVFQYNFIQSEMLTRRASQVENLNLSCMECSLIAKIRVR